MTGNKGTEHKAVTEARRAVILSILQLQSEPATPSEITVLLADVHERGDWPQATWNYARNDPYDCGTRQHLEAMAKNGLLELVSDRPDRYRVRVEALVAHAAEALAMQADGATRKQIGEELGLSASRVARILTDPTGADERLRKKRYCPGCGARKQPAQTTCEKCVAKKAETYLPPDTFLMIARRYEARTGCPVLFGVTHGMDRVIRIGTPRGVAEHVLDPRDSWEDALVDAGLADE